MMHTIIALGMLGSERATPALAAKWESLTLLNYRMAVAFDRIGDPRAIDVLAEPLKPQPGESYTAALCIAVLLKLARTAPAALRERALTGLVRHTARYAHTQLLLLWPGREAAIEHAAGLLAAGHHRIDAALVLAWLGDRRGLPLLLATLRLELGARQTNEPRAQRLVDALAAAGEVVVLDPICETLMRYGHMRFFNLRMLERVLGGLRPLLDETRVSQINALVIDLMRELEGERDSRPVVLNVLRLIGTPEANAAADAFIDREVHRLFETRPFDDELFYMLVGHQANRFGARDHPLMRAKGFDTAQAALAAQPGPESEWRLQSGIGYLDDSRVPVPRMPADDDAQQTVSALLATIHDTTLPATIRKLRETLPSATSADIDAIVLRLQQILPDAPALVAVEIVQTLRDCDTPAARQIVEAWRQGAIP
ncbi:MAG: hypothetical protein ACFB51_13895 [Anaerolineae bacterium]